MSKGYVYALSNQAMPGLIKIGRTCRSVQRRAHELYQTGVPTPFDVVIEVLSPDCVDLERRLHLDLSDKRLSDSREFFRLTGAEAQRQVQDHLIEQMAEMVSAYAPEYTLIPRDDFIDGSSLWLFAQKAGCAVDDVGHILDVFDDGEARDVFERSRLRSRELQRVYSKRGPTQ
jgi:hypothetical protein